MFTKIQLMRDNQPPLEFLGVLEAEVTTNTEGDLDRWTEYKLYRTEKGRFIAQCLGRSCLPHEWDFSRVEVFEDLQASFPFFRFKGKDTRLTRDMHAAIREKYPEYHQPTERVE